MGFPELRGKAIKRKPEERQEEWLIKHKAKGTLTCTTLKIQKNSGVTRIWRFGFIRVLGMHAFLHSRFLFIDRDFMQISIQYFPD